MSNRIVLKDVPKLAFYDGTTCPECELFPVALKTVFTYLAPECFGCIYHGSVPQGCHIPCTYTYFMLGTGIASCVLWDDQTEPDAGNPLCRFLGEHPEKAIDNVFTALGVYHEWITLPADEQHGNMMDKIREWLGYGCPVIGFGIVGPPDAACIITGMDDDVILGWSAFQDMESQSEGDPIDMESLTEGSPIDMESQTEGGLIDQETGYFRQPAGLADCSSLLFPGLRYGGKFHVDMALDSMRLMLDNWKKPMVHTMPNGAAAYEAWAAWLESEWKEDEIPEHVMRQQSMAITVAGRRWWGSRALAKAAGDFSTNISLIIPEDAPNLERGDMLPGDTLRAAACWGDIYSIGCRMWELGRDEEQSSEYRLADIRLRREIAALVWQIYALDIEAMARMEAVLAHVSSLSDETR